MFYSLATRPASRFQRHSPALVNNGALDKFLDDTLGSIAGSRSSHAATVEDGDKAYSLQLDVPGLAKEQLDIGIEGDLPVSAGNRHYRQRRQTGKRRPDADAGQESPGQQRDPARHQLMAPAAQAADFPCDKAAPGRSLSWANRYRPGR
jgi:hypothetical protein